jgi:hypothetical protein
LQGYSQRFTTHITGGVVLRTSYKVNSFVAVVVVFHVAIKLPHSSNGAAVGPTFEVCVSAKVLLPFLGN